MKYKIWLYVKEIDEDTDHYEDIESESCSVAPEFDTLSEAQDFKTNLLTTWSNHGQC